MTSRRLPPKKDVALALLEGPSVFVHLDPRQEGVIVPKHFARQQRLILQIGLNMAVRIPDLNVDEEGISCTLSFNRSPFWCSLPWNAVFALVGEDGRGMVWPDDVPPEVASQLQQDSAPRAARRRPRLSVAKPPPSAPKSSEPEVREMEESSDSIPELPEREAAARLVAPEPMRSAERSLDAALSSREADGGSERRDGASKASEGAPRKDASRTDPSRTDSSREAQSTAGGRRRRALPPYLRVVK